VTDHQPPRAVGEREVLRAAWQYQRDSLVRKVRGVSEADADRELVVSGTTLRWLVQHACFAERIWVRIRFAAEDAQVDGNTVPSTTVAEAIATYEAEWPLIDAIVDAHDLDEAIYLSDRIVVLGARPGRIQEIIEVPVSRPRSSEQLLSAHFLATRKRLEELIYQRGAADKEELKLNLASGA